MPSKTQRKRRRHPGTFLWKLFSGKPAAPPPRPTLPAGTCAFIETVLRERNLELVIEPPPATHHRLLEQTLELIGRAVSGRTSANLRRRLVVEWQMGRGTKLAKRRTLSNLFGLFGGELVLNVGRAKPLDADKEAKIEAAIRRAFAP